MESKKIERCVRKKMADFANLEATPFHMLTLLDDFRPLCYPVGQESLHGSEPEQKTQNYLTLSPSQ